MKKIIDILLSARRGINMLTFQSSEKYWIERYKSGGNSGFGSYGELARFKADTVNTFVSVHKVQSIIEFGCGDGNQLTLAKYPCYHGFDVSPDAIAICRKQFADDATKHFSLMCDYSGESAELALSLDVLYHLVEDEVYCRYLHQLFTSAQRYTIIYSTNKKNTFLTGAHIKHRLFINWIEENITGWQLTAHIPGFSNPVGGKPMDADFFIFEKKLENAENSRKPGALT